MFWWSDTGSGGSVGVAFTALPVDLGDAQDPVTRDDWFGAVSTRLGAPIVVTRQVHGAAVHIASGPAGVAGIVDRTDVEADALVTTQPGLAVAVRVADCVPILLADPGAGVVAAVHAGRAGLLAGVIGRAAETMTALGARELTAWIGPHICAECYEVPASMADEASRALGVSVATTRWGTPAIDLGGAAAMQASAAGATVIDRSACTLTTPGLPSHRRDAGTARAAGIIWMEPVVR